MEPISGMVAVIQSLPLHQTSSSIEETLLVKMNDKVSKQMSCFYINLCINMYFLHIHGYIFGYIDFLCNIL